MPNEDEPLPDRKIIQRRSRVDGVFYFHLLFEMGRIARKQAAFTIDECLKQGETVLLIQDIALIESIISLSHEHEGRAPSSRLPLLRKVLLMVEMFMGFEMEEEGGREGGRGSLSGFTYLLISKVVSFHGGLQHRDSRRCFILWSLMITTLTTRAPLYGNQLFSRIDRVITSVPDKAPTVLPLVELGFHHSFSWSEANETRIAGIRGE